MYHSWFQGFSGRGQGALPTYVLREDSQSLGGMMHHKINIYTFLLVLYWKKNRGNSS